MTNLDEPPPSHSTDRRKIRRGPRRSLARFWSEWRLEIVMALVAVLAIFLIFEQIQIRETLSGWMAAGAEGLRATGSGFLRGVVRLIEKTTFSDLVGYALLIAALAVFYVRGRWRLMTMARFTARACPRCGQALHRVHRRPMDRLVNSAVPVARYRCRNPECNWRGLRVRRARFE